MLLARKGYRVLMVDRATFPSDTISTHVVQPTGVAALRKWGLLDRVIATGCPPVHTFTLDFGPFQITGAPGTDESPLIYAPRRFLLDQILVDGAVESGVEFREGFAVEEIRVEDGRVVGIRGHGRDGRSVTEAATVVIGADGLHSLVAKTMQPEQYHEKPRLLCGYYAYWSGLPEQGVFENFDRPGRGFAVCPTNDGLTMVIAGWPYAEFAANKSDVEGNYMRTFDLAPEFAERLRAGTRETRIVGTAVPNYFRRPYGPGWTLVGDAGYNRDFITAQGISDAFRDAELCVAALDATFTGTRAFEDAMSEYQSTRDDQVEAMYELTTQFASLEPAPPELEQLLGAVHGNQEAMDQFARMVSGVTPPEEFFADDNVERIMAAG